MIVSFIELGEYEPGTYQELLDNPEEFLAKHYGKKKIKLNFYLGENFVCTINFKVAGVLDSARLQAFIAAELKVSVDSVQTMVLGRHGDQRVPLIMHTTVAGVPMSTWEARGGRK